jgi:hypothetical protein
MSPAIPGSSLTRTPAISHGLNRLRSHRLWYRAPAVGTVGALFALLAISACGGSHVNAQSGPATSPVSASSTTPTSQPPSDSPRAQAIAGAIAQVNRYERLLDELAIHPRLSLDRLYVVSTEPDVTDEIAYLNHFRSAGERQIGHVQLSATRAGRVDLTSRPHARPPRYPSVVITTCLKVSGVRTVNSHGKSTVANDRKPYFLTHLTLVNVKFPASGQWLVKRVTDTEEQSCGA